MKQFNFLANISVPGLIFMLTLASCNSISSANSSNIKTPALTNCLDPRPQICTMEYRPVCAKLSDNSHKTYASACSACADTKVVGHIPQACPKTIN